MITKYGYSTVGIVAIGTFILLAISIYSQIAYVKYPLAIIAIGFMLFTLYFFRDPDRNIPQADNIIISPADGKVLVIKDVVDERFIKGNAKQISIFMSPLDVHVNRIPIDGKVDYVNYVKGEYLVAYHDKADTKNERSEIGITSKYGKVLFTQVAGFVARRIVYVLNENDSVKMGERFGMIKFGSRVDVIVSPEWNLRIKEGDVVKAGESILFDINN